MYILSNGVKITERMHQGLCQAIKDTSKKYFYFLEIETGKLIRISRANHRKLAAVKRKPQRFISLLKVSEKELQECFGEFNKEMINIPKLQTRLSKEIENGAPIKKLEKILEGDPSGWIHGWVQWEQFFLAEKIEKWITAPPLNARDDPDYWFFDDCPICQLLKKAEEKGRNPTKRLS